MYSRRRSTHLYVPSHGIDATVNGILQLILSVYLVLHETINKVYKYKERS